MKINAVFLIMVILAGICMFSCNRNNDNTELYDVYISGGSNDTELLNSDFKIPSSYNYKKTDAESERRESIDGAEYTGKYYDSYYSYVTVYNEDRYYDANNKVFFYYRDDKNDLLGYTLWIEPKSADEISAEDWLDNSKAREKADIVAAKYTDITKCKVIESSRAYGNKGCIEYYFRYRKIFSGFPSNEYIGIAVLSSGEVRSCICKNKGMFDGADEIAADSEKLDLSVAAKIKELYSDYNYKYEIKDMITARTRDDRIVISVGVSIKASPKGSLGSNTDFSELITLYVFPDSIAKQKAQS